ncbi:Ribosomal RNA small subunit methyltransferase F [compost metagenome]
MQSTSDRGFRQSGRGVRNDRSRDTKDAASCWRSFQAWAQEELPGFKATSGTPILFGDAIYLLPHSERYSLHMDMLSGLKIPRAGLHLGNFRKDRFHPAHALAMASAASDAAHIWNIEADSSETAAYLHGDTLTVPESLRGWVLVNITCGEEHFPLGWGKASNGQLKNHLPKGLRNSG